MKEKNFLCSSNKKCLIKKKKFIYPPDFHLLLNPGTPFNSSLNSRFK